MEGTDSPGTSEFVDGLRVRRALCHSTLEWEHLQLVPFVFLIQFVILQLAIIRHKL